MLFHRRFGHRFERCLGPPQDGINWTQVTASAPFSPRYSHTSLVFNNEIWVIGGGYPAMSDVWYSPDGVNWTEATANAAFGARYEHSSVVFNNEMWVINGDGPSGIVTDAWYSADGVNWTQATNATPFLLELFTALVYNN